MGLCLAVGQNYEFVSLPKQGHRMGSTLVLPVGLISKLDRADDQAFWPGGAIGSALQRGRPLAGMSTGGCCKEDLSPLLSECWLL